MFGCDLAGGGRWEKHARGRLTDTGVKQFGGSGGCVSLLFLITKQELSTSPQAQAKVTGVR